MGLLAGTRQYQSGARAGSSMMPLSHSHSGDKISTSTPTPRTEHAVSQHCQSDMQMPSDVVPGTPPRGAQSSQDVSFSCSWPSCRRTYRKREHLQRHERSRESPRLCLAFPVTAASATLTYMQMHAISSMSAQSAKSGLSEGMKATVPCCLRC